MSIIRSHLWRPAIIVLVSIACDDVAPPTSPPTDHASGDMPVESWHGRSSPTRLGAVVASLPTPGGGDVSFLDLGDGAIGVAERARVGVAYTAMPLLARLQASPLEIYLALGGRDGLASEILLRDHERHARETPGVPSAPRALVLRSFPLLADFDDPGLAEYHCDGFLVYWWNDWTGAFTGITKYRAAAYTHNWDTPFTWYPGALVYRLQRTNSLTYLGSCNGDAFDSFAFRVQRYISGAWTTVFEVTLGSYQRYTFYGGVPAYYRGVAVPTRGFAISHLGYAAAWSISPALATP